LQNHASFHGTVNLRNPASIKAFRPFHDENHPHSSTKTQRKEAHRFYEREGMTMAGYHFYENIASDEAG